MSDYFSMNTNNVPDLASQLAGYGSGNSPTQNYMQNFLGDTSFPMTNMPTSESGGFWSMDNWFGNGKTGQMGIAPAAIGAVSSLGNAWLGMKQYGLAKKQFKESKRQFNLNYARQTDTINRQLEDRQRARVAANSNAIPVAEYMAQYGVS